MKILLVDDEPEILEILREFLELKEHDVTTASNGKQALDLVLASDDFDLVFSDIKMPEMDGLTFLEKVRNNSVTVPVILISGQGDLETNRSRCVRVAPGHRNRQDRCRCASVGHKIHKFMNCIQSVDGLILFTSLFASLSFRQNITLAIEKWELIDYA